MSCSSPNSSSNRWAVRLIRCLIARRAEFLDTAAFESKDENARKLLKGVEDLHTYVERNREFVPNYGERYRNGEKIASGFVESAINQVVSKRMVKKQQMGWSQRGAHLLLQIRTRVLDEEWENTFRRSSNESCRPSIGSYCAKT